MERHEGGSQYRFKLKNGKWGGKIHQLQFNEQQQQIVAVLQE